MARAAIAFFLISLPWMAESAAAPIAAGSPPSGEKTYELTGFRHDVGAFDVMVTNLGILGTIASGDSVHARWRGCEYLSAAGLWIGARVGSGAPSVSTAVYETELRPSPDPIDTLYPSFEGSPGGNPLGASLDADDDGDGVADEEFQNYKDDDGDGLIDEDFAAVSDQMWSCEYWDDTPEAQSQHPAHRPLHVKVRQRSFAWAEPGDDEFIGVEVAVSNTGMNTLTDVYLGYLVDADIGPRSQQFYFTDDGCAYARVDSSRADPLRPGCTTEPIRFGLPYMFDVPDPPGEKSGDADGFLGLLVLGHTIDPDGVVAPPAVGVHACRFWGPTGVYPIGPPRNDVDRYHALSAASIPTGPTLGPSDYAMLASVGPFPELAPGGRIVFEFALVVGEGYYGATAVGPNPGLGVNGQPNEHTLLANALRVWTRFHNGWNRYGTNLAPPVPLAPADGAVDLPSTLTLRWGPERMATAYHLSIARDAAFTDTVAVGGVFCAASSITIGPLGGPARYHWRIRSLSGADSSEWSPTRTFTTQDPYLHIYPGDCNEDGVVDARDILPLGRYFGSTGQTRANASLEWRGQPILRTAWTPPEACAADCDGSGRVDSADVTGIIQNWYRLRTGGWLREVDPASTCLELLNAIGEPTSPALASIRRAVLSYMERELHVELTFQSEPARPNPFRRGTTIFYRLPRRAEVVLLIHDASGRLVRRVKERDAPLGPGAISWDGTTGQGARAPAGVYFYRLEAGPDQASGRVVLVEGR